MPKTIFYSWLSDVPGNKSYLLKLLEQFVAAHKDYVIESADRNPQGADDIAHVIIEKIKACDYFVGDVSLINPEDVGVKGKRITSNPNVLYELGYASALKTVQIVLVANKLTTPDAKELPFDIRNRRLILQKFNDKNTERVYQHLEFALTTEQEFDQGLLRSIVNDAVKIKKTFYNPEYAIEHVAPATLNGEFSYFFDFVRPKLPAIRRSVGKHSGIAELVTNYIESLRRFARLQPEMGIESYDERLAAANEVVLIVDQLFEYIMNNQLASHRDYIVEVTELKEQIKSWASDELEDESNYQLTSFYKFHACLDLYYSQLIFGGRNDESLLSIATAIQPLLAGRSDQFEIETAATKISAAV